MRLPNTSNPSARTLAASLREEREARGVRVRELAEAIGTSPAMLSQWETGKRIPSTEDVSAILGHLRITGAKREHIRALARHAREPNWLSTSHPGIPHVMSGVVKFEKSARAITTWSPTMIPGLLQTADYIRMIMDNSFVSIEHADIRIGIRLERQKILTRKDPVRLRAYITERMLRDGVGDENIMSDQVDHLLAMSERDNICLRILPTGIPYHPGFVGPFEIYEFADTAPIILLEHHRCSAFLHEDVYIKDYQRLAKLVLGYALSEEDSRAVLQELVR